MKRILAVTDAGVNSGYGILSDHILSGLAGDYEIFVSAINYNASIPHRLPYFLMPAHEIRENGLLKHGDQFGLQSLPERIRYLKPDLLWLQNDLHILRNYLSLDEVKSIPVVTYFPIDGKPISPLLAEPLKIAKANVTYTKFGQEEMKKKGIETVVIPPGLDSFTFHPIHPDTKKSLKKQFGLEDKFVVLRVDKFQPRKNYGGTIKAFAKLAQRVPEAHLYTHCRWEDSGGDLMSIVACYPELTGRISRTETKGNNDAFIGLSTEMMCSLYNMADVFLTTTMGEGFGISVAEAMACEVPVVGTDYAGTGELLSDGRGYPIRVAKYETTGFGTEHAVIDEESAAIALKRVYKYPEEAEVKARRGGNYIRQFDWTKIISQWDEVVKSVING